jgi:DNA-binding transcriptional LysR family regulator
MQHDCLTLSSEASQTRGWAFRSPINPGSESLTSDQRSPPTVEYLRPRGRVDCSDGQVLHTWCLQGLGIAWRSAWEVRQDLRQGRLVEVLASHAAPPNGIYAVFPHARHLPLRVRLWIDFLKHTWGDAAYWDEPPT